MFHFFHIQNDPEDESGYPIVKHGKLSLVDLAGKEKIQQVNSFTPKSAKFKIEKQH